jgi:hypothetical protein
MEGKKQGKGKYEWSDGSYYDGEWYDNKINGFVSFNLNIFRGLTNGQMDGGLLDHG